MSQTKDLLMLTILNDMKFMLNIAGSDDRKQTYNQYHEKTRLNLLRLADAIDASKGKDI